MTTQKKKHKGTMDYSIITDPGVGRGRNYRQSDGACAGISEAQRQRCLSGGEPHSEAGKRAAALGKPIFDCSKCRNNLDYSGCGKNARRRCGDLAHVFTLEDFERPNYRCGKAPRRNSIGEVVYADKCACAVRR